MRGLNTKLLRRGQEDLLTYPVCFDMDAFFSGQERPLEHYAIHCVGTTACIAGRGLVLSPKLTGYVTRASRMVPVRLCFEDAEAAEALARSVFGVSPEEGERLFYVSNWPNKLLQDYKTACKHGDWSNKADAAIRRIEHFVRSKGQD